MTFISLFVTSFVIALSGAMMPGPLLTATISESVKRGPVAGPLIMSGHALLEGVLVAALIAGVAPLLQRDMFFVLVSFGGALILAWMAYGMFRSLPHLRIEWGDEGGSASHASNDVALNGVGRPMKIGILLSLANPYWVVWWATIGLGLVARSQTAGLLGVLIFFLGHQAADFAWYTLVSTAVGKGRRFFSDRIYRGIIAVSALVLIGFAVYFGWSGAERLALP
ncbi:MAG TPA: LysE family transporter [Clostridia bacterium]|nr:LysE family transporter [Clostridia bacterium]